MRAVYRKEMRQYFRSPVGYVFLAIFLFINAFYFLLQNLLVRSGDITDYFQAVVTLEMFLIPMLTMRSFAEERKQRTDVFLLTMPVDERSIVLGKFLAAESVFLIGLGATLVFPVILALCGSVQPLITLGNYLGIILLMSAFIAVGIFASALSENQIVAAVLSYVMIFLLWYSYGLGSAVQNELLLALLNRVSVMQTYHELVMGILDPAGILLYVVIAFVFLVLTTCTIQKKRG
jgi:ABC-2 type transport system permease protein